MGDFGVVEHGVDGGDGGDAQGDCLECQYAPAEVSVRVQFLDRAQNIVHQADEQSDRAGVHAEVFREGPEAAVYHVPGDVPCKVTGPINHRNQGSNGNADQAEFQDEGDCGHEVKDGFDYRDCLGHQEVLEYDHLYEHEKMLEYEKK